MDSVVETVKGTAYPLNSKRLRLQHIQHLARALGLPAAAPRIDLEVMIGGKITELRGEETQAQVMLTLGELLLLRDKGGTFFIAPPIPALSSKASTPSQGSYTLYDSGEDAGSFTNEVTQLQIVLSTIEEEKVGLKVDCKSRV